MSEYKVTITLIARNFDSPPTDPEVFDLLSEILVPGSSPEYRNEELGDAESELVVSISERGVFPEIWLT